MQKTRRQLVVIGAGGHAKVVIDTAQQSGWIVKAVYDDNPLRYPHGVEGIPISGPVADFKDFDTAEAVVAIGDNVIRQRISKLFPNLKWAKLIHPRAYVAASATIGDGTVVFANAVVQPGAVVGGHCIINTSASIDHDSALEDFVHVAPGARVCGGVRIGCSTFCGAGCTVLPGISLGANCVVGAGAVVTRDIAAYTTAVGVPASGIRKAQ